MFKLSWTLPFKISNLLISGYVFEAIINWVSARCLRKWGMSSLWNPRAAWRKLWCWQTKHQHRGKSVTLTHHQIPSSDGRDIRASFHDGKFSTNHQSHRDQQPLSYIFFVVIVINHQSTARALLSSWPTIRVLPLLCSHFDKPSEYCQYLVVMWSINQRRTTHTL